MAEPEPWDRDEPSPSVRKTLRALWISLAVLGSLAFFIVLPWALRIVPRLGARCVAQARH